MSTSLPTNGTVGVSFLSPITGSALSPNLPSRSSAFSNVCMAATSTRAAVSDWPSVNAWSSNTVAASGSNSLRPAEDPPSASPSRLAPDRTAHENPERPDDPRPRTVLLVEDNQMDVFVIAEVLKTSGLNLHLRVASNGQEALAYVRDVPSDGDPSCPALILLDLNLPKVSGIQFLRELRTGSPCSRTPVIIVTSSTAAEDRIAAQTLGADAYFQKPTDLSAYLELGLLVKRVLDTAGK
jgi:CheY-like chemotaxis protein